MILGLHHVTAIAGDAQRNLDFYAGVLGLRLVKQTVNFDDPSSYHLYYGDGSGAPGTILTFFAWPDAGRGREGNGQISDVALSIPSGSLEFWRERLGTSVTNREGTTLSLQDADGMKIRLVEQEDDNRSGWNAGSVPAAHAIRGLDDVTLTMEASEHSQRLLTDTMGFHALGEESGRLIFQADGGGPGSRVGIRCRPTQPRGTLGAGSIHHVAFRVDTAETQARWRNLLLKQGSNVSPVMDRSYFESIYFREPGGALYEIATDAPGFATDEAPETLGQKLQLPAQFESYRAQLEAMLPPLKLPTHD